MMKTEVNIAGQHSYTAPVHGTAITGLLFLASAAVAVWPTRRRAENRAYDWG